MPIACKFKTLHGRCTNAAAIVELGLKTGHPSDGTCLHACKRRDADGVQATLPGQPAKPPTDWLKLWGELHLHVLNPDTPAFLDAFVARLPCGSCRNDFTAWIATNPPNLTSQAEWWYWTWRAHNAVSKRIGKPTMSFVDAADRWFPSHP